MDSAELGSKLRLSPFKQLCAFVTMNDVEPHTVIDTFSDIELKSILSELGFDINGKSRKTLESKLVSMIYREMVSKNIKSPIEIAIPTVKSGETGYEFLKSKIYSKKNTKPFEKFRDNSITSDLEHFLWHL
jgi:hypothetical protein